MKLSKPLTIIILVTAIIVISLSIPLFIKEAPLKEGVPTIEEMPTHVTTDFALYEPGEVRIPIPIVKYKLSNGTIITVYKKNPFRFDIELSPDISLKVHPRLRVFKVKIYTNAEDIFKLASMLGIDTNKLYYNNVTKTYIFYNATHVFEYSIRNGFIRFKLRDMPVKENATFPSDEVLIKKAIDFLKNVNLLYLHDYEVRVGNYYVVGETVVVKAVVLRAKLDGILVNNLGLMVLMDSDGNVVGLEGIVLRDIDVIGEYITKSLIDVVRELKIKISHGKPMTDWYLNWLAFTKLYIKNVSLQYYLTSRSYVVPVYVIEGEYELDYDIIHDKGDVHGLIIAIKT
jgi:hypothetical protein